MMRKPFDLLNLYARFGREQNVSLGQRQTAEAFLANVSGQLERALSDPTLLHGQRTAAMFEALVIALGRYKLIKVEDIGRIHPVDAYRAADFRVVLEDGEQWLVEVKNVYESDPQRQRRRLMTPSYFAALDAYAQATDATLKLAVFWARWGIWTLISPGRLLDENGYLKLEMLQAMRFNEMVRLGDLMVGTRPPLRLRFTADSGKPNTIGDDGQALFTIGDVTFFSEERELVEPVEKEIAWIFINYGDWVEQDVQAVVSEGDLEAVEFSWLPEQQSNKGFEIVGTLSRMFSRYYALRTMAERDVIQIEIEPRPDWFGPLTSESYKSQALPLWRFLIQPPEA